MKIYKYRSCANNDHLREILGDSKFYFADWRDLNDPMEGYFRYYSTDHSPDELRKIVQGKDRYGISCFSLTSDEILLWSHYANNHKGICIEVDTDCERSECVSFEIIKYQNNIPWVKRNDGRLRSAKEILSTKIFKWDYEKEIRAFCDGKDQKQKVGTVTKIILGIGMEEKTRALIKNFAQDIPIISAKLNFNTNAIDI